MEKQGTIKYLGYVLLILAFGLLAAKKIPIQKPNEKQPETQSSTQTKTIFYDKDHDLFYVPASLKMEFLLGGLNNTQPLPFESESKLEKNPIIIPEGPHTIKIPSSPPREYKIVADGTPPHTVYEYSKTPRFQKSDKIFYGKGLTLSLDTKDNLSGIQDFLLSSNHEEYKKTIPGHLTFQHDGDYTFNFYAIDRVGNKEPDQSISFYVDTIPPTTSMTFVKGHSFQDTYSGSTSIMMIAKDVGVESATIYTSLDNEEFKIYTREIHLDGLKPGAHHISYYSVDAVANKEAARTYNFQFDPNPPVIKDRVEGSSYLQGDLLFSRNTTKIIINAEDAEKSETHCFYQLQGDKAFQPVYEHQIEIGAIIPSQNKLQSVYTINIMCQDTVANQSIKSIKLFIDETPPHVEFTFSGKVNKSNETTFLEVGSRFQLIASDSDSGLKKQELCIDKQCQLIKDEFIFNTPGNHEMSINVIDNVGNTTHIGPIKIVVQPSSKENQTEAIVSKKEWVSQEKYGAIGPANQTFTLWIADGPDTNADHVFKLVMSGDQPIFADDNVNSMKISYGTHSVDMALPVDTKTPDTSATFANAQKHDKDDQHYFSAGLEITLKAEDKNSEPSSGVKAIYTSLDGQPFQINKEPLKTFLSEKEYILSYYSLDRVGNKETIHTQKFIVDLTQPLTNIKFEGPHFANIISKQTKMDLQATDQLSGVAFSSFAFEQRKFKVFEKDALATELNSLKEGKHTFTYNSQDFVKNIEALKSYEFILDQSPPSLKWSCEGDQYTQGKSVFIGASASLRLKAEDNLAGVKNIQWKTSVDDKEKNYTNEIKLPVEQTSYQVSFQGTDLVENKSEWDSISITVDKEAPHSTFIINGEHYQIGKLLYVQPSATIAFKAEDNQCGIGEIHYRFDTGSDSLFHDPIKLTGLREFDLSYFAIDRVNNQEATQAIHIITDDASPEINVQISSIKSFDSAEVPTLTKQDFIYLTANDSQSGLKEIYYQLDDLPKQKYRVPIQIEKNGKVELKVFATDWVNNQSTKKYNFIIGEKVP